MIVIRARFAPSPTGDLHVGSASTALASFVTAARAGGKNILRIEDIDTPRVVPGSDARILEDLAWLGLDFDEGPVFSGSFAPYVQSMRSALYENAIADLGGRGLVYPCDCSRAEITRGAATITEASAPHGSELRYPGTCRDASPNRAFKRPPALRLRIPEDARVKFTDGVLGNIEEDVAVQCGDFVLRRGDGLFGYHLAVTVDDAAMQITDIVRGADLLSSTARQILLLRLLGAREIPRYSHVPLVLAADGTRLAKRNRRAQIRGLREDGASPEAVLGLLAHGLGLAETASPKTARQVAAACVSGAPLSFSRTPICFDDEALAPYFRSAK